MLISRMSADAAIAIKLGYEGGFTDCRHRGVFAVSIGVTIGPQFTAAISSMSSAHEANSVPVR
jgi:hypothetical protein